jgi:Ca2+-binding RTX toxin-like protein
MPIIFNAETNSFEGENLIGTYLPGFDFSVFGGLITNNGNIVGPLAANSEHNIEIANGENGTITRVAGSPFAVDLLGSGARIFTNEGVITGNARFGSGADSFHNDGALNGRLAMGAGNDVLINRIVAGGGADGVDTTGTITGTVDMGDGDDLVGNTGLLGNVLLGDGNDVYYGVGFAAVEGTLHGQSGDVRGGSGNDTIEGSAADDKFYGGDDNDQMLGFAGRDQLFGDNGDDFISGGDGNDKIWGGAGKDTIRGDANNDKIYGGNGDDLIYAGTGNDIIEGGDGFDRLAGVAGNNRISGGAGRDWIDSGSGRDTMTGGDGADSFQFRGDTGRDVITDFSAEDEILLLLPVYELFGFDDILAHTEFTGGNAVIDLSGLLDAFSVYGPNPESGSVLTINNVSEGDLTQASFSMIDDVITFKDDILTSL